MRLEIPCVSIYEELVDKKSIATTANQLELEGTTLRNQGKGFEAIKKYEEAKALYLQSDLLPQAAGCQHMIGVSYKIQGNLEKALEAFQTAIADYLNANDTLGPSRVERDIGIMYEYVDLFTDAKAHLLKSENELRGWDPNTIVKQIVGESASVGAELGVTLAKLGLVYTRLGEFDDAKASLFEALSLTRASQHPFYEMTTLLHGGELYIKLEKFNEALLYLQAGMGILYENRLEDTHKRRMAQIWGLMAHAYLGLGVRDNAQHYARRALFIIDSLDKDAQKPLIKDVDGAKLRELSGLQIDVRIVRSP